ncbi:TVP38/TMEM64 family protein [Gorillibacterium sp. sgz5001074]|uniref:TVP38/TMEM64 family protein n=1 Tax=Gorillibacterium sp. sgz5001074 TaxID=3446695 RepID=UPI003F66553C
MRKHLKWITFLAVLALLLLLFRSGTLSRLLTADPEVLKEQSQGSTLMLLAITLMLMVVQNLFTVIPLFLLVTVNITLFDFTRGYMWSWFTSIVGGLAAFYMTRYWVHEFLTRLVNERMRQAIEENGFWMVLVGRLLPLPSSVVNVAAGISSVGWRSFLYATVIGNMVYIFTLSFISERILSIPLEGGTYAAGGVILVALIVYRIWKRRKRKSLSTSDDAPA